MTCVRSACPVVPASSTAVRRNAPSSASVPAIGTRIRSKVSRAGRFSRRPNIIRPISYGAPAVAGDSSTTEAQPLDQPAGKTDVTHQLLGQGDLIGDAAKLGKPGLRIEDQVGGQRVPVAWLTDAARIDQRALRVERDGRLGRGGNDLHLGAIGTVDDR